ncbi:uncharacterized protein LOC126565470 [Anopheles maculipalpis]|uniref:uncharacterized protein LOC126565470 n=1 Tax=Anopheles maculipalpis TaxID=1496333 RepID=UPI002159536D|nr:uncharacterized protein LOC126565470 [Anopheles maculipalpis]
MIITTLMALHVLSVYADVLANAETIKFFKIDRITNCEPVDEYPVIMLPQYGVTNKPNENLFNCTLRIKERIEGPLKYNASIKRCEMDLSKCEFFNTIETEELCEYFNDTGFNERFLNSISQPLTCPTKPGDYLFINNKWDLSAVVNLPGSAYRWNIVTTVSQVATGREIYCTELMARIMVIRKKTNRIKH